MLPLREQELELLGAFVGQTPCVVVQGYKSLGKSTVVNHFLRSSNLNHTVVQCDECVTKKLLLQRCLKGIRTDSGIENYTQVYSHKGVDTTSVAASCESFAGFSNALEQFFLETNYTVPHVLVLDRFDQCMDQTNDIMASFARLHEQSSVSNLTIVFVISTDIPKDIATLSLPTIYFNPYTSEQVKQILQQIPRPENTLGDSFWAQYVALVVDSFFAYTGPDVAKVASVAARLWDKFTEPVTNGRYTARDFVKVYRENAHLFTDEKSFNNTAITVFDSMEPERPTDASIDIPTHSKYLLIASYLASFNEPKNDLVHFSKLKTKKKKKRNASIDNRLLSPNYFDLERLLAILSVIYKNEAISFHDKDVGLDDDDPSRDIEFANFRLSRNIDINSQIATLVALGLLVRTSASDILNSKVRWKCNIAWETVESIANDVQFPLQNYLIDE